MLDRLWQLLLGRYCVLCREAVKADAGRRQLCRWCLASLPWRPDPEQHAEIPGITRSFAPFAYAGVVRQWVLDAKHDAGLVSARMLGVLLAESLQDAYPFPAERPELLIPVPLTNRRLRARGHNQAVLIAVQVSRILGVPLKRSCARRIRETEILAGFGPKERRAQVARGFAASSLPPGSRVAIIDDVVTTGATATALASALKRAGAAEVHLWASSMAPHPT